MCASEDMPDRESPPNITAWSSSVTVMEKLTQGGGLDPFIEGENHNPRTQVILIILYESINQPINIHILHNFDLYLIVPTRLYLLTIIISHIKLV